ncbi:MULTISPECIES: LysR family transcriptional regulator [Chelativorans]|jgi:DNA-binding transcriptional LysR family regulator|uniref:Transcriptional regulator, LysR family n=1 Tax=Chelativorans sp. (strain BNC1) TaxID=266779 RepID=Q11CG0_CHESB|nr:MULTISPECIES: LysR family transcriptional regulator [Chelativorans]
MDRWKIDLFTLRGFSILMEERNVSRAAFKLGLKQPTMSRMLAKLRAYFDDPLLVWSGGHMVPTPRAILLESEIHQVLATMERLSSSPQEFDPKTSGLTIRLAATGYTENVFLARVMSEVAVRAPGVQLEIRPPDRLHDTSALEKGEVDFLVGWNVTPAPVLRSRVLFTDELVCIARAGHPALEDGNLSYERYVALPHVQFDTPSKTTTELLLHERLAQRGDRPFVQFRVQNLLTVAEIVANSDLIATVSKRFVISYLQQYQLSIAELPVRLPVMQNRAWWHERMHREPYSHWFRSLLAEIGKTM